MMNPDVEARDESNIEIIISRDYLRPDQTHPPLATSNAVTPSDIYWHAYMDEWGKMEPIVKNDPNSVLIPLTGSGATALHVAAGAGNIIFAKELTKLMKPEDQLIPNSQGMLAVHLAALSGHHRIVKHFCSQQHLLDKMAYEDIEKLFFMTISNNMFDAAMEIFEKHPLELSTARDKEELTALHMLARKPSTILCMELENDKESIRNVVDIKLEDDKDTEESIVNVVDMEIEEEKDSGGTGIVLLKRIWAEVGKLRMEEILELITRPSVALFDAIKSETMTKHQFHKSSHTQKVERKVPHELRSVRNKKGKRPIDVFYDEHKQLSKDIKEAAKGIADSGMIVATLVATVAFAAALTALTVPGDKNNAWFIVFIVTNTVALFSSCTSIICFLSNFTYSRLARSEFVVSLNPTLQSGSGFLIISFTAMVLAFIAASFLIFAHTTNCYSMIDFWYVSLLMRQNANVEIVRVIDAKERVVCKGSYNT
ncbi:hypothetical protein VNO80_06109 [Phaseolus coccineus]|uniref:PGG domain-containing protein n=1 Tax=Phaseolus coccineus TaxID=3886 RepID=A0AAN9RIP0_PHACN